MTISQSRQSSRDPSPQPFIQPKITSFMDLEDYSVDINDSIHENSQRGSNIDVNY